MCGNVVSTINVVVDHAANQLIIIPQSTRACKNWKKRTFCVNSLSG